MYLFCGEFDTIVCVRVSARMRVRVHMSLYVKKLTSVPASFEQY